MYNFKATTTFNRKSRAKEHLYNNPTDKTCHAELESTHEPLDREVNHHLFDIPLLFRSHGALVCMYKNTHTHQKKTLYAYLHTNIH